MRKTGLIAIYFGLILLFVTMLPSCSVTKLIPQGKYIVTKNNVRILYPDSVERKYNVKNSAVYSYIPLSQTPNTRFLGIDFRTWIYLKSENKKDNWWHITMRKIGQQPVYYDSTETEKSISNMEIYMASEGYLDNKITSEVKFKKNRVYVDYLIDARDPYFIDSSWVVFNDKSLKSVLKGDSVNSLIKQGKILSRKLLENERTRVTDILNDKGYYTFTVNDIDFLVDTFRNDKSSLVQVNINDNSTGGFKESHKLFKIRNINIFPNYNNTIDTTTKFDTVVINRVNYMFQNGEINIKPKFLNRQLQFSIDSLWSPNLQELTTRNYLNLKYYRTSSIDFAKISTLGDSSKYGHLDTYIRLMPAKLHSIKGEGEISSNSNYTSIIGRFGYSNRNLFRHSEQFDITANIGYDIFYGQSKRDAYQIGLRTSLSFPKLLVPFRVKSSTFINNIESTISVGYDMQNRPYYRRHIFSGSFGYKWSNGTNIRYNYNPVTLSYVTLPRVDSAYLNTITNPYLRNTYTNQIIAGTNFSLIYTKEQDVGSSHTVKFNAETAGNVAYVGSKAFKGTLKTNSLGEKYYEILNIRYAQYARIDVDYGYEFNFNPKNSIVTRFYLGAGSGYGNSTSMPFERLFYSGGNSSMRGWQIRALGPGNTLLPLGSTDYYPNSLGDIRLELNLEGRFAIWGPLRGAMFFDLGNVWSNGRGETNKDAVFRFDTFYKQLGFNTGIGLRFDLGFFVLRLDWGIVLHNPNRIQGDRWIRKFDLKDTSLHFAIGYPF